ncbi:MAG TPA: tetratricopeptide repeat-containing protein, partial [Acidimicrobiia bacterium]|nr:tetratricopeptide repeat-containing protein [Acidimicrobiia bacterium]
MSFFDSPLGEQLRTSLDAGKPEDIAVAVGAIEGKVWSGKVQPDQVEEVLAELQRQRQVQHVIDIADAATAVGSITTSGRRRYCQMLIESGALHAGELACAELLDLAEDAKERGEALGLLGRIRKQRYVTSRRSEDLIGAIAAYQFAYAGGGDPLWHGINLLALTTRAHRDGILVPQPVDTDALTRTLLDEVRQTPPELKEIWERTTEVEALVALGDKASVDEAVSVAQQLASSKSVRPFELESLRRQLADIWELEPHHPVLVAIAAQKLQLGARAHVELP